MPNDYLRDVHAFLRQHIQNNQTRLHRTCAGGDSAQCAYYQGQLEEFLELRGFLSDHFDLLTHNYNR